MRAFLFLSLIYLAITDDSSEEFEKIGRMNKFKKMIGSWEPIRPVGSPDFLPMGMRRDPFVDREGEFPGKFKRKFMKGKKGFREPAFLRNATDESRRNVFKVIGDSSLTAVEKDIKIEEILKSESPEIQNAFQNFKTDMAAHRVEWEKKLAELRKQLSPEAKEADEALSKVMQDIALSPIERREQIKEIFDTLPMNVKMELREFRRSLMGNRVAMKIREVGDFIGDIRMGIMDAFRSALGVKKSNTEIRRAPMRRLKFPESAVQLETKPIAISEDDKFVEF